MASASTYLVLNVDEGLLPMTLRLGRSGYLLCWASFDLAIAGDLRFQTLADAERAATKNFAVTANLLVTRYLASRN